MRRRKFIALLGGAAAWPLAARAQQQAGPVVGYLNPSSPEAFAQLVPAFRKGLSETGFIDGRNVTIDFRWANDQFDRLPELATDLVRRQVGVIVTVGNGDAALAAKAASATIPIVFVGGFDPVRVGLVASLNRPAGNVTGITGLSVELSGKRLALLHEAAPRVARVGLLLNAANANRAGVVSDANAAASALGLQIEVLAVTTDRDIDAAFASLASKGITAVLVASDTLFTSRRVQLALQAVKHAMLMILPFRENAEAGGLMSYGPNTAETHRQGGIYAGQILKGEKPADLPVIQATKFEFIINMQAARIMGIEIPTNVLALADQVIE
jgi:putative ABC transport system substrate-binding protein